MKFFKTYPFRGDEEVQNEPTSFYYQIYAEKDNAFEIVENIFKGKKRAVTYRKLKDVNQKLIEEYHRKKYNNLEQYQIEEFVSKNTYKITDFKKGVAFRFYIFHLNEAGKVVIHQWYDTNYNLLQYQEEVYSNGNHIETRIFYPSSWNISKNKLI